MKNKAVELLILIIGTISMAFSGLDWQIGIFAWIAPICLLYYTRKSGAFRFVIFLGLMFVAGYFSQTINNLFNSFVYGLINGLAYAVIYTIIYLIDKLIYTKGKGFYSTLIFPSVFVIIESSLSSLIGTSGIVAQSQFTFSALAQLSTITGIFGITFIVIWFASIINWLIEHNFNKQHIRTSLIVYGSVFLFIMTYGILNNSRLTDNKDTVKVATISGITDIHAFATNGQAELNKLIENTGLEIPENIFASEEAIRIQITNTTKAAENGAKVIVWSEDALILNQLQIDSLVLEIKAISKKYNAYILLAFLEQNILTDPKLFNNKSLFITPKGIVAWEYRKSHLAPPEIPIINQGNSIIPYFDTEYGRIGNVICYDLDFPGFLHQTGKNSIDIMLVPAYDWKEYAPLHSKMARFEALQSGFSLIRSNGNGINIVTDSYGHIIAEMNTFTSTEKILYADLPLGQNTSIYSKTSKLFIYLTMLFLLVIIGFKKTKRNKINSLMQA